MRGTMKISEATALHYLHTNYNAYMKVNSQISAQRQVVNLEDDPLSANVGIRMLNITARTTQYNRNIKTGLGMLNLTDGSLGSSKEVMDKINTLVIAAASDPSATSEQRQTMAVELNELFRQLVTAANSFDGERYIFGGLNTTTAPFDIVNGRYVNYRGDDKNVNLVVDYKNTQAVNCTGSEAYGSMVTVIKSRDYNPDVSLATDVSTRLEDLNEGKGVPKGKIMVYYSAYPDGVEIDLSNCDTLEDVKDYIESETYRMSQELDPDKHAWLDKTNLNWHDLQDRYVRVTLNPEHNGISLQEFDKGEPLPQPTARETQKGLAYVAPYTAGSPGLPAGPIYNQPDYVNKGGTYYAPLRVDDVAQNGVATALGVKGTAVKYDPLALAHDPVLEGFIHGKDLKPKVSDRTLLADIEGYNDAVYTLTNGSKPGVTTVTETSQDANNHFSNWNLTGLSKGNNTGPNGELYSRVTHRGPPDNDIFLELYTVPVDKAKQSDLVATGVYNQTLDGGTVIIQEANGSGVGGTVGIVLPPSIKEAKVDLLVDFSQNLQASIHVPAFVEEQNGDGTPRDVFNIASGWNIRGLDKPPATGYDENHPASTDLEGDVCANFRMIANPDGTYSTVVDLYRPSFNNQPATLIASGELNMGATLPPDTTVSGRVQFVGAEGFEGVSGSVYLEIPAGTVFNDGIIGTGAASPTTVTYALPLDVTGAARFSFGGCVELVDSQWVIGDNMLPGETINATSLKGDTLFLKGQVFTNDVGLPDGSVIPAGTPLPRDMVFPKGVRIGDGSQLLPGTRLAAGQEISFSNGLAAGTVVPRGSYVVSGAAGFPANGMMNPNAAANPIGFDVRATFATVEDFNRAVEQAGVHVTSRVSGDGKGIEFISNLAGAYLTVTEDTDCYEQMNDKYQQLSALNLDGMIKGVNSDRNGNVYTEVIFYPPDASRSDNKVLLHDANGKEVLVDAGYYVRVYSDADQLKKPYADRDNTKMVAEGFVAAEKDKLWPGYPAAPATNTANPYNPTYNGLPLGVMNTLILEERNDSGLRGTVNLDYYGGRDQAEETVTGSGVYDKTNPYVNDAITVFPGGLRPEGSRHVTVQEWDMTNIIPGITCDYSGTYHATITRDSSNIDSFTGLPAENIVCLYRDSSRSYMTAKGEVNSLTGVVTFYEVDPKGNYRLDNAGNRIEAGTMTIPPNGNKLLDGQSDNFTLTTGAQRTYGQEREDNIFATINDILDALHANDAEKLGALVGSTKNDINRLLTARGDVGARSDRLALLTSRHDDELISYKTMFTTRVGMDLDTMSKAALDLQATQNAYNAALQSASKYLQMSLLDYMK